MKILYTGKKQKIIDSVDYVNDLFEEESFWSSIDSKDKFDFTEYTPADISSLMKNKEKTVTVKLYSPPFYRHRGTNAYTDSRYPNVLFYNSKKLWRSIGNIVNTITHEYVHSVDYTEDSRRGIDYGHGSQSSSGKMNSAPYWIGDLAEKFFNSEYGDQPYIDHSEIDPIGIIKE